MAETQPAADKSQDKPSVIMLPPVLMVLHLTAGFVLNWVFGTYLSHAWGWLGIALLAVAIAIVQWSKKLFEKAGTNVPPNMPATAIVTDGPYKYSRNPMYVCFLLWFAGLCLVAGTPLALLMLFPFAYILDQHVIVPEENYLSAKFGDQYLEYKNRVRRWV